MAEPCLCIVTVGKIFGINLSELTKLEFVDWESISSPTFDFCLHLPETKMCPFVLDSKIYMAAGLVGYYEFTQIPSYKIYEFELDDTDDESKKPGLFVAKSIPDAPVPFAESFIVANISGDVYFFADPRLPPDGEVSLWVLRSGRKEWNLMSFPPPFDGGIVGGCRIFVLQDKIFLAAYAGRKPYLASFDPGSETWTQEDNNMFDSFHLSIRCMSPFCLPIISVSVPGLSNNNRSVILSRFYRTPLERIPDSAKNSIAIFALLVNHQKGVLLYQRLDECFEGIQPTIVCGSGHHTLVDLGNSKLCALLYGHAVEHDLGQSPVLCTSVFTLSKAKDFIDTDSGAPPSKEQRFLSVSVHSNSVYAMENCGADEYLQHAFIYPPKKEGRFQHIT